MDYTYVMAVSHCICQYGSPIHKILQLNAPCLHNIIQIHTSVMWDRHYSTKYSHIHIEYGGYFVEYRQSHMTLLWI